MSNETLLSTDIEFAMQGSRKQVPLRKHKPQSMTDTSKGVAYEMQSFGPVVTYKMVDIDEMGVKVRPYLGLSIDGSKYISAKGVFDVVCSKAKRSFEGDSE